jgi:tetratricopeptide (TPR) repeat protein
MSQQPAASQSTSATKPGRAGTRANRKVLVWVWTHKISAVVVGGLLGLGTVAVWLAFFLSLPLGLPALPSLIVALVASALTLGYGGVLLWSRGAYHAQYHGKRLQAALKRYVARRVSELNKSDFVPAYASKIDPEHPTARLVRDALETAERSSHSRATVLSVAPLPVGVCIFGEPLQDKTGLAWEAMRTVLPGWTFVKWPHVIDTPNDIVEHSGERVVLWLDDLHEYGNRLEAVMLDELIDRFADVHKQVVVVATCRWHEDEREARAHLGYLLDHLLPIRLATKPGDRSEDPVVLQPTLAQPIIQSSTPPQKLADLISERTLAYRDLIKSTKPEDKGARAVLRALALLRSAGILVYAQRRVRAIAHEFGLEQDDADFRKALKNLEQKQFIRPMPELVQRSGINKLLYDLNNRSRGIKPEKGADIVPVSEWYLERVVAVEEKQAEDPGTALFEVWEALGPLRDTAGLILLGDAYLDTRRPYLRNSSSQAIQCYESALESVDAAKQPVQWAAAQIGLGNACMVEAGRTARKGRATPLTKALKAYETVTKANGLPGRMLNAEAWQGVGNAHRAMAVDATQADDTATAIAQLEEAEKAFTASIEEYKNAHAPAQWALTHFELATVHSEQAKLEAALKDATASLDHLTKAEASFRQAREVYTRSTAPTDWAKIQADLGASLLHLSKEMAETTPKAPVKDQLDVLQQAVDTLRSAMTTFRLFRMNENWAAVSETLAEALVAEEDALKRSHALKSSGEPTPAELAQWQDTLTQAVEAYTAALQHYRPESAPLRWGKVQIALANTYLEQSKVANQSFGASDANIKAQAYRSQARTCVDQALTVLYRAPFGAPFDRPEVLPQMQQSLVEATELMKKINNK